MNRLVRILLACFVGAFIGSLLALQLRHAWPLGSIVGAFIAYLGYDFEAVIAAIPKAYRAAEGWQPDYPAWRAKFRTGFCGVGFVQTWLFLMWPALQLESKAFWPVVLSIHVIVFTFMFALPPRKDNGELIKFLSYWDTNPVSVFLWHLPRGLWWVISRIPLAVMFSCRVLGKTPTFLKAFVPKYFRLVHSELRLLCAVDAALGTVVGYFSGNALAGAIAGAALGVLNYEIITVRVMQVAGAKSFFDR